MPHFSKVILAEKFGAEERLTFTYYLRQARPSFAFVVFLADELNASSSTSISVTRLITIDPVQFKQHR